MCEQRILIFRVIYETVEIVAIVSERELLVFENKQTVDRINLRQWWGKRWAINRPSSLRTFCSQQSMSPETGTIDFYGLSLVSLSSFVGERVSRAADPRLLPFWRPEVRPSVDARHDLRRINRLLLLLTWCVC